MNEPLDLLVSDIMGPFTQDPQGYRYLLTIRDHVSTYSIVYPLKSRSDALDAIAHLKLGISFHPLLPYSPQENGKAKRLNRTLGDMARAMLSESGMPDCFWQFAYASACYLHNLLPNRRCPDSSPHQVLYGHPPSIVTLYPFGKRAIVHMPAVNQPNKLAERGVEFLLKPLLASRGWLLWDPTSNQMIHSASMVFPRFQMACPDETNMTKGSLGHVLNTMSLGQVPTELYFKQEEKAINSLPLAKDILVPENLKQALASSHRHHWERACLAELDQIKRQNVWQAIDRKPGMNTIGHRWVFDKKINEDGNIEKFKARLVAWGNRQRPGVDCMETYAPTESLMSHRLLLETACLQRWKVCSFDISGAYLYSQVEETVLMEPPTHFIPYLEGKVLRLQKALYGMKQAGRFWWLHLLGILEGLGFTLCEVDLSLYMFRKDDAIIVIWIHVENGVIASNSPAHFEEFRKALCENFEIKWSDNMRRIVGLECDMGEGEVTLSQTRLTNNIIGAYPRKIVRHNSPLPPISTASPFEVMAGLGVCCELPGKAFNGPNGDPLDHTGPSCGISAQDPEPQHHSAPQELLSQPVE
ncbi:hypothetical protein O181_005532 [Austropuccinia psidii MF-1]|uniref:Integrase catalytic domain-containing protein n=1 Tax=Austropuccinia psidii MF-1 TaxID=1389203 RepID=A0A9Q3BI99_9BASI|nr:hypothetical protein [Austropuccinia psidii MF-1]